MARIDNILEDTQKQVELYGTSGEEAVFLTDLAVTFYAAELEIPPINCDFPGAVADFAWFLSCEEKRLIVPHQSPDSSFWLRTFGEQALPYGYSWDLKHLRETLLSHDTWRRAILYNPLSQSNPPCVVCYQFQNASFGELDLTVTMRSSDVAKVFPQDVIMSYLLLCHVSNLVDLKPGSITFNLGNAHVYWADTEFGEEFAIDDGL